MIDYAAILKQAPNGVLATRDGQGVRTRVFQFLFADGNKAYFCTGGEKPVYKQLQADPNVSFCAYPQDFNPVLSITGKAVFTDDVMLKTRVLDENPLIKNIYKTPGNPGFKLFYVEVKEIETFTFAEGSKHYKV